ncbi:MAG: UbiD family decarboxylase [Chloroflexi bacterium]|nr:UbiD family decarboxylase [Chloroflexota bacterium]
MKPYNDLREFIQACDEIGELKRYDGADWNLEIGALTELESEQRGSALLFDEVPGYPSGYRVFTNGPITLRRSALALGFPLDLPGIELLKLWKQRFRELRPIPPVEVDDGPVLENVITGEAINLFKFPVPKWHELDGGRFIGTQDAVITRDPDEGWVNLGTYRVMCHDKKSATVMANHGKHNRIMMDKYHRRGEPCPAAVVIGADPLIWAVSMTSLPWGVSEYDFAGSFLGEPMQVVRAPYTGLPVPANAEIVIEGEIPPLSVRAEDEGPFGEWAGYYSHFVKKSGYVLEVKSVLHRHNPVLGGAPPLRPPMENDYALPFKMAGAVWYQLEVAGISGIKGVWQLAMEGGPSILVVALKQQYAGHAKQVALAAASSRGGAFVGKVVIVVDDDVDITDNDQVLWALGTRMNVDNVDIVKGLPTDPTDPSTPPGLRYSGYAVNSRLIIDACRPYATLQDFPPVNVFGEEYRKKIREKWGIQVKNKEGDRK